MRSRGAVDLAALNEQTRPPRDNGELVFDAPWQARVVGLAVAVLERADQPWDAFRRRLVEAIAEEPNRPYYESWTVALESLVVTLGLTTSSMLDAAGPSEPGLSSPF